MGIVKAVLTSTHNLCFEQKYVKYQNFLSKNFHFLMVKFSVYLNRRVFVMSLSVYILRVNIFVTIYMWQRPYCAWHKLVTKRDVPW